jgi:hypothetical protein
MATHTQVPEGTLVPNEFPDTPEKLAAFCAAANAERNKPHEAQAAVSQVLVDTRDPASLKQTLHNMQGELDRLSGALETESRAEVSATGTIATLKKLKALYAKNPALETYRGEAKEVDGKIAKAEQALSRAKQIQERLTLRVAQQKRALSEFRKHTPRPGIWKTTEQLIEAHSEVVSLKNQLRRL